MIKETTKHPENCQCGNHEAHTAQFRAELEPKTAEQALTSDLNLIRLAEWLAIEHDKTKLQFNDYLEPAQELIDYLHVLGFNELDYTKCKANIKQQLIEEIIQHIKKEYIPGKDADIFIEDLQQFKRGE